MDYLDEHNRLLAAPEPRWITSPKRLRVFFGGAPIVDSTRANLFRGGGPPVYYFPKDDVRQDTLAGHRTHRDERARDDGAVRRAGGGALRRGRCVGVHRGC